MKSNKRYMDKIRLDVVGVSKPRRGESMAKLFAKNCELAGVTGSSATLIEELTDVWEKSVRVSHQFLSEADIIGLRPIVTNALREIPILLVAVAEGRAVGFMGIDGDKIEMFFVVPASMGQGVGSALMCMATLMADIHRVDVNEQNPSARAIYEHWGFRVQGRSEVDGQGNPFPILHMVR